MVDPCFHKEPESYYFNVIDHIALIMYFIQLVASFRCVKILHPQYKSHMVIADLAQRAVNAETGNICIALFEVAESGAAHVALVHH